MGSKRNSGTYQTISPHRPVRCRHCGEDHSSSSCPLDDIDFIDEDSSILDEELTEEERALLRELESPPEANPPYYDSETRTVTGVIRIMKQHGNDAGAELVEEMEKVAKSTRQLHRVIRKKTGKFETEDLERLQILKKDKK